MTDDLRDATLTQALAERDVAHKAVSMLSQSAHVEWTRAERAEAALTEAQARIATLEQERDRLLMVKPHPASYIIEEMLERDWSSADIARRMPGDYGVNKLALDMCLMVGPHDRRCFIGEDMDAGLAEAFGVSPGLFLNLERAWRESLPDEALAPAALPDGPSLPDSVIRDAALATRFARNTEPRTVEHPDIDPALPAETPMLDWDICNRCGVMQPCFAHAPNGFHIESRFYARGSNDPPGLGPVVVCDDCGLPYVMKCQHHPHAPSPGAKP